MSSSSGDESPRIFWALDYGTKNASLAFWIGLRGQRPHRSSISVLKTENGYAFPQIIAYKGSVFHFGQEVLDSMEDFALDQPIQLLKLSHYPEFQQSERGQYIAMQLKASGRHVSDVLADHFRAFEDLIKPYIKRELLDLMPHSASQIDDMQMEAFLAVPACWDGLSNRIMSDAAVSAGFEVFELVGEPQCHLAFIETLDLRKMQDGSRIIVIDGGAGTVDCTTYIINKVVSDPSRYEIMPSNSAPQARACGSEMVTERFLAEAERQIALRIPGGIRTLAKMYNTSPLSIKINYADDFEPIKRAFSVETKRLQYVTHRFSCAGQAVEYVDIDLDSANIRGFFDPVIEQCCEAIDSQIEGTNNVLLLRGGFAESRYLQSRIKERYGQQHIVLSPSGQGDHKGKDQHVVQGALRGFNHPMPKHWPPGASLGLCQDEVYEQNLHPDCCKRKRGIMRRRTWNKHLVRQAGKERLAEDRVSWLIRRGEMPQNGRPVEAERWLEFSVDPKSEKFILIRLVCSANSAAGQLRDHEAVWTGDGKLRPGFELMQPIFKLPNSIFREDLDSEVDLETNPKFKIPVRLQFTANSREILLKVQVVKQGVAALDGNGYPLPGVSFAHEQQTTVWSMGKSHFVRQNAVFDAWGALRPPQNGTSHNKSALATDVTSNPQHVDEPLGLTPPRSGPAPLSSNASDATQGRLDPNSGLGIQSAGWHSINQSSSTNRNFGSVPPVTVQTGSISDWLRNYGSTVDPAGLDLQHAPTRTYSPHVTSKSLKAGRSLASRDGDGRSKKKAKHQHRSSLEPHDKPARDSVPTTKGKLS